ncbi:exopolysaccharide phosphotransferase cps2G [Glutamicibacter uratoxydans]|uniref:Exopolysaccharide phosphotransferase cps2G n=1 Tax=Glutamicibacter uratoxydans TaxID=43667 RepID=A0A4Y4DWS9_GLUUR|nr:stealth family protein [Glutamicibacter uratoxydans]GED07870.1 exopolysaccharide phosphotransferase cps2G [Glutamicibacter uratoxydans]
MTTFEPIDFVVTWVDDDDLEWREMKNAYLGDRRTTREGASESRFRDWGALRYWFRAIEENCEWVRKIFLVTVNPLPSWLKSQHPKLVVVHHEQFIPGEYLPTFNSRVIEIYLHRIPDLSEKFVYFNDDMYVLNQIDRNHFFPKGRPAAIPVMNALSVGDNISHAMLNNIRVINENFNKRIVIKRRLFDWFSLRLGHHFIQNIALLPWHRFTGFHNHHLPLALLKSTYSTVWNFASDELKLTSESKFRQFHDINPFLFYYWQLCSGVFTTVQPSSYGRYFQTDKTSVNDLTQTIREGKERVICINDGEVEDYESLSDQIEEAFLKRFPNASSFETSN